MNEKKYYYAIRKIDGAMPKNDNTESLGVTSSYDSAVIVCTDDFRYSINSEKFVDIQSIEVLKEQLQPVPPGKAIETHVIKFNKRFTYLVEQIEYYTMV